MINYDKLPERIDIDIKGNIYVQKLPMEERFGLLCPYAEELSTVCNIRCAKCAIVLEDMEADNPLNNSLDSFKAPKTITKTCWRITCCDAVHRAKQLYRQRYSNSMDQLYQEVPKRYTPSK